MRAVLLTVFGLAACGGDYTEAPDSGTAPTPGTSSGSPGTSSGSPGSSDAGVDAAPATGDKGLGATPGTIACGREICDVTKEVCCAASATDQKCQDKSKSCSTPASCDDAADCKSGQKCCGSATGFNSAKTSCVDKCEGLTSAQTCRTNEECGAQDCVHQSCYGVASWLCGLNTFCQKL